MLLTFNVIKILRAFVTDSQRFHLCNALVIILYKLAPHSIFHLFLHSSAIFSFFDLSFYFLSSVFSSLSAKRITITWATGAVFLKTTSALREKRWILSQFHNQLLKERILQLNVSRFFFWSEEKSLSLKTLSGGAIKRNWKLFLDIIFK